MTNIIKGLNDSICSLLDQMITYAIIRVLEKVAALGSLSRCRSVL